MLDAQVWSSTKQLYHNSSPVMPIQQAVNNILFLKKRNQHGVPATGVRTRGAFNNNISIPGLAVREWLNGGNRRPLSYSQYNNIVESVLIGGVSARGDHVHICVKHPFGRESYGINNAITMSTRQEGCDNGEFLVDLAKTNLGELKSVVTWYALSSRVGVSALNSYRPEDLGSVIIELCDYITSNLYYGDGFHKVVQSGHSGIAGLTYGDVLRKYESIEIGINSVQSKHCGMHTLLMINLLQDVLDTTISEYQDEIEFQMQLKSIIFTHMLYYSIFGVSELGLQYGINLSNYPESVGLGVNYLANLFPKDLQPFIEVAGTNNVLIRLRIKAQFAAINKRIVGAHNDTTLYTIGGYEHVAV